MKVELGKNKDIVITAETNAEAYALKHIADVDICASCGRTKANIVIDASILAPWESGGYDQK